MHTLALTSAAVAAAVAAAAAAGAYSEQEYEEDIVGPIRSHWLHQKADFTVVEQLIPDIATMMVKDMGQGEEDRVQWNFVPIEAAWKDHMAAYSSMTEAEIEEQLQRSTPTKGDEVNLHIQERTVCALATQTRDCIFSLLLLQVRSDLLNNRCAWLSTSIPGGDTTDPLLGWFPSGTTQQRLADAGVLTSTQVEAVRGRCPCSVHLAATMPASLSGLDKAFGQNHLTVIWCILTVSICLCPFSDCQCWI